MFNIILQEGGVSRSVKMLDCMHLDFKTKFKFKELYSIRSEYNWYKHNKWEFQNIFVENAYIWLLEAVYLEMLVNISKTLSQH